MSTPTQEKHGFVQIKPRPEVKAWIDREAEQQERSRIWVVTKIVEDAFARSKQADQPQGEKR